MVGQKRQLLYDIAHLHFFNEAGIDEVENMNKPNPKNEYFYIRIASQQSCSNWQKPIKKSLLTVVLSPSLNPLGQTQINRLSNMILIVVLNLICPDNFVLIVENKKEERYYDCQPNKQQMHAWIDLFPSGSIVRPENNVVKRQKRNSEATYEFLNDGYGCILLEDRDFDLGQQEVDDFVDSSYQNNRV